MQCHTLFAVQCLTAIGRSLVPKGAVQCHRVQVSAVERLVERWIATWTNIINHGATNLLHCLHEEQCQIRNSAVQHSVKSFAMKLAGFLLRREVV